MARPTARRAFGKVTCKTQTGQGAQGICSALKRKSVPPDTTYIDFWIKYSKGSATLDQLTMGHQLRDLRARSGALVGEFPR